MHDEGPINQTDTGVCENEVRLVQDNRQREVVYMVHGHRFTIADDEAVQVLLDKMLGGGIRKKSREKLLKALDEASRHYQSTSQKERQAFFHGLLTGYAVALKLL